MEIRVFVVPHGAAAPDPYGTMAATAAPSAAVSTLAAGEAGVRAGSGGAAGQSAAAVPGRNEFLLLLTTQLKYQDPLQPLKDHEFIAQLAQFSTLEELQGLNRRMGEFTTLQMWVAGMGQAATLIGRQVTVETAQGTVVGRVEAVQMRDGIPHVTVLGRDYPMTAVVRVE